MERSQLPSTPDGIIHYYPLSTDSFLLAHFAKMEILDPLGGGGVIDPTALPSRQPKLSPYFLQFILNPIRDNIIHWD